jgi:hypothetical protein
LSATFQTNEFPPIGVIGPPPGVPFERDEAATAEAPRASQSSLATTPVTARERPLSEQPTVALLSRIARLEGSLGAALSLLRRCIVERKTPTREALAAEAGFALGLSPQAALAELDEVAQIVGVSSLQ